VVIDDDRVTLTMLQMLLFREGHHVIEARDGESGLAVVKKERPDLVLSDMLIPKLHGLDLCQRIKQNPELAHIKIILMTAVYKGAPFRTEVQDSGADAFLVKPIETGKLLETIRKLLGGETEEKP